MYEPQPRIELRTAVKLVLRHYAHVAYNDLATSSRTFLHSIFVGGGGCFHLFIAFNRLIRREHEEMVYLKDSIMIVEFRLPLAVDGSASGTCGYMSCNTLLRHLSGHRKP